MSENDYRSYIDLDIVNFRVLPLFEIIMYSVLDAAKIFYSNIYLSLSAA